MTVYSLPNIIKPHSKYKGAIFIFIKQILKRQKYLEKQIHSIKNQLNDLPAGKLICCHNGKYSKWYQSDGHSKTYIPKSNRTLVEQLAFKKYLSHYLSYLSNERNALSQYLKLYPATNPAENLLENSSAYRELLTPYFSHNSTFVSNWLNETYTKNPHHPEKLIHKTGTGIFVLSKAESMITTALYTHKIPFRYECLLQLGEFSLYPDFTLLHPHTHEIFYWEHFGLINDSNYARHTFSKLQLYTNY